MAIDLTTFRKWADTLADLDGMASVLSWDRAVTMPPSGAASRSYQLETLAAIAHRELTRPGIGDVLVAIAGDDGLEPATRREAELLRRSAPVPSGCRRTSSVRSVPPSPRPSSRGRPPATRTPGTPCADRSPGSLT